MRSWRVFFMVEGLPGTFSLPVVSWERPCCTGPVADLLRFWYGDRRVLFVAVERLLTGGDNEKIVYHSGLVAHGAGSGYGTSWGNS